MAVTLVATAGASNANSFATEAQAAAYANERMNLPSTWTTVSGSTLTDAEKRALIEATRELNLLPWVGTRTDDVQALSWPREWAVNPDAPLPVDPTDPASAEWPVYFDNDEIPERLWKATIELAFEFLRAGTTDLAALDANQNVIEKTVDVLTTKYSEPWQRAQGLNRFPRVMTYISDLLDGSKGGMDVVRV